MYITYLKLQNFRNYKDINSFDQEGVQLGKKLALKIIDQFAAIRQGRSSDNKSFALGAAYLKLSGF